jgi:hypothetical protein
MKTSQIGVESARPVTLPKQGPRRDQQTDEDADDQEGDQPQRKGLREPGEIQIELDRLAVEQRERERRSGEGEPKKGDNESHQPGAHLRIPHEPACTPNLRGPIADCGDS